MKNLFTLLVFFIPLSLFSQLANTSYLIPSVGISIPANNDSYKSSFNAGIAFEFAITKLTAFGIETNIANVISKNNSDVFPAVMGYTYYGTGNYTAIGFSAYGKIQSVDAMKSPWQPFAKIGLGTSLIGQSVHYTTLNDIITKMPYNTSTGIMLSASAGANIMINGKNKIVLEAQFRVNKSDTDDIRMVLLNIGYAFRL